MSGDYNPEYIEKKWQSFWESQKVFEVEQSGSKQKFYCLDMFPYPSGAGLHVGHPVGYTGTDIVSRYKRMKGFDVLHPMGFDAFGLPAEQHAQATGEHPSLVTKRSCERFITQLKVLGFSYSWDRLLATTDEEYYHWTQWIFLKLYNSWFDESLKKARPIETLAIPDEVSKAGPKAILEFQQSFRLAYYGEALVNWCPALGTVLANEEVIDGKSERGGHDVIRRPMKQWFLRITKYGERLVDELEGVDWPENIKEQQRNWVGRKEGALVTFKSEKVDLCVEAFTTRPDTLFGVTFVVLSPEHHLVDKLTHPDNQNEVAAYKERASRLSDLDRTIDNRIKTGAPLGTSVINPVTGTPIPLWIGDYVLASYGTGVVMGVPAHDARDFEFATKYELSIRWVIAPAKGESSEKSGSIEERNEAFGDLGIVHVDEPINDFERSLVGLSSEEAHQKIVEDLEKKKCGRRSIQFKLRDWLFSRQRYWGEPIPIIHWEDGTLSSVPESELPLRLPEVAEFKQADTGESPLANAHEWLVVKDPVTGKVGRRETNTMPQWAGSCWYYLRYIDPRNSKVPWDPTAEARWMPVDLYVGGAEHAVLHLLYSRFWHKVLFDLGYVSSVEPFKKLANQGFIISEAFKDARGALIPVDQVNQDDAGNYVHIESGQKVERIMAKMSKSLKNVVDPLDVIRAYGADTLRMFVMFMGPFDATKVWDDKAISGVHRFLKRAWTLISRSAQEKKEKDDADTLKVINRTIKRVTDDIEGLRFNTAIASLMECCNATFSHGLTQENAQKFVLLLAPFAPHISEELWQLLGNSESLAYASWPEFSESELVQHSFDVVIQVGGRKRGVIKVAATDSDEGIKELVVSFLRETPYKVEPSDTLRVVRVGESRTPKLVNVVKC